MLFNTTFNKLLYESSGKEFLHSFFTHQTGDILICYEDSDLNQMILRDFDQYNHRLLLHNITNNKLLVDWTYKYKKHIPKKYGGVDQPDLDVNLNRRPSNDDRVRMFRYNTARWFRKIVSLSEASKIAADVLVFCDADIIIKKQLDQIILSSPCADKDYIYHMGKDRLIRDHGVESGFMVFNLQHNGAKFINQVIQCYTSGDFLKYKRWDDGYIFAQIVRQCSKQFQTLDVVQDHNNHDGHVVKHGIFAEYIDHFKGRHKNLEGIKWR